MRDLKKREKNSTAQQGREPLLDAQALRRRANLTKSGALWSDVGVAYMQAGNYRMAKEAFLKSITLEPGRSATHFNLGNLELAYGSTQEALDRYQRAAELSPENPDIHLNRGNAFKKIQNWRQAKAAYELAINLDPTNLVAIVNLGNLMLEAEKFQEALSHYQSALAIDNNNTPALIGLGNTLCQLKRYSEAEIFLLKAVASERLSAEAHCNLSHLYLINKAPSKAQIHAEMALSTRPDFPEALSNLALAKKELGDLKGAISDLRKAILLQKNYTPALANLAVILKADGQLTESLKVYREAMASAPFDPVPAYNASLILLQLGEFEYGWKLYENRWKAPNFDSTQILTRRPRWDGESTCRSLLVWPEQGIGDQVMFCSLLEQVQSRVEKLTVVLDKRLIPIFRRSMPEIEFIPKEKNIPEDTFDFHIPAGSLPRFFCTKIDDFKKINSPYLKTDTNKTKELRKKINIDGKKTCGISWKSGNKNLGAGRSISLTDMLTLIHSEDTRFINLQYGETEADIMKLKGTKFDFFDIKEIDKFNDIDDLFCLIDACDYVISIDNSTVHFAGAIGKPTVVLLPGDRDWRWTEHRDISLWYPSVKYTN
jgi:tetratricopeptide (TPR) repeat protein